jgi:NAD(P)-dependent dehydrogenase (short-subunit alcohol dehydrogenase family)
MTQEDARPLGVISGGSSAIGAAAADALLATGHDVVLLGRDEVSLRNLAEPRGERLRTFALDVTSPEDWAQLVRESGAWGTIRALVCVAGVAVRGPFLESDPADWRTMWQTNVVGTLLGIHSVLPQMLTGGGRIILVSSAGARIGLAERTVYSATKGAIEAFARSLAVEIAGSGVTVNALAPGAMPTDASRAWLLENPDLHTRTLADIPEGRFGRADELEPAFRFLLESPYSQGSTVTVDGGWSI